MTAYKVGGSTAKGGIVATITNLRTGRSRNLALRLHGLWRGDKDSALSASVSRDGSVLLLVGDPEGSSPDSTLRLFSMQDGHELSPRTVSHSEGCSINWLGDDPVLSTKQAGKPAGSVQVTAEGSRSLVALHPRLQSRCVQWAADALEGGHGWHLFGTWAYWWTWYWFLVLPVLTVPLVAIVLVWRRRRRA